MTHLPAFLGKRGQVVYDSTKSFYEKDSLRDVTDSPQIRRYGEGEMLRRLQIITNAVKSWRAQEVPFVQSV
jgi:hypothetical protein